MKQVLLLNIELCTVNLWLEVFCTTAAYFGQFTAMRSIISLAGFTNQHHSQIIVQHGSIARFSVVEWGCKPETNCSITSLAVMLVGETGQWLYYEVPQLQSQNLYINCQCLLHDNLWRGVGVNHSMTKSWKIFKMSGLYSEFLGISNLRGIMSPVMGESCHLQP